LQIKRSATATAGDGIKISGTAGGVKIYNVDLVNPFNGIHLAGTGYGTRIQDGSIVGIRGAGILSDGSPRGAVGLIASNVAMSGDAASPGSVGVKVTKGSDYTFDRVSVLGTNSHAFWFHADSGNTVGQIFGSNLIADNAGGHGFLFDGAGTVHEAQIVKFWSSSNTLDGVFVDGSAPATQLGSLHFILPQILSNQRNGFHVNGTSTTKDISVLDGIIANNNRSGSTFDGVRVEGTVDGFSLGSAAIGTPFASGLVGVAEQQKWGLNIANTVTNVSLTNPALRGNLTGKSANSIGPNLFPDAMTIGGGLTVSNLTSGRVPIVGTAGLVGDDADLTFGRDTLTATKVAVTNTITSYNGVATVANGVPSIVALNSQIGLTAALGATTVYTTPTTDGFYEATAYGTITTAATSGAISFALSWTDADSNTTASVSFNNTVNPTGVSSPGAVRFIKVKASTAIQISTTFGSVVGTPTYNVYTMVKKVN
jgi:hypothetical protein